MRRVFRAVFWVMAAVCPKLAAHVGKALVGALDDLNLAGVMLVAHRKEMERGLAVVAKRARVLISVN